MASNDSLAFAYEAKARETLKTSDQWMHGNMDGAQVLATQAVAYCLLAMLMRSRGAPAGEPEAAV